MFGGIAGYLLGTVAAPKSGIRLRRDLAGASENIYRKASYELQDLANKIEDLKHMVAERQPSAESVHDFTPSGHGYRQSAGCTRSVQSHHPTKSPGFGADRQSAKAKLNVPIQNSPLALQQFRAGQAPVFACLNFFID